MNPQPTGAWDLFRSEVRAGKRTKNDPTDPLWFAAMCDANGLDALDDENPIGAAIWFAESAYYVERMAGEVAA